MGVGAGSARRRRVAAVVFTALLLAPGRAASGSEPVRATEFPTAKNTTVKWMRLAPVEGTVVLTFDDGPHPRWTPMILDILREEGVLATFFVNGFRVERHPEVAARIIAEGHSLQNHTWGHSMLTALGNESVVREVVNGARAIEEATGYTTTCVRPPFGATSERVTALIRETGHEVIIWDKDSEDYNHQSGRIVVELVERWEAGDNLMFHDSVGYVYQYGALVELIHALRDKGLGFSTICANPPANQRTEPPAASGEAPEAITAPANSIGDVLPIFQRDVLPLIAERLDPAALRRFMRIPF